MRLARELPPLQLSCCFMDIRRHGGSLNHGILAPDTTAIHNFAVERGQITMSLVRDKKQYVVQTCYRFGICTQLNVYFSIHPHQ